MWVTCCGLPKWWPPFLCLCVVVCFNSAVTFAKTPPAHDHFPLGGFQTMTGRVANNQHNHNPFNGFKIGEARIPGPNPQLPSEDRGEKAQTTTLNSEPKEGEPCVVEIANVTHLLNYAPSLSTRKCTALLLSEPSIFQTQVAEVLTHFPKQTQIHISEFISEKKTTKLEGLESYSTINHK